MDPAVLLSAGLTAGALVISLLGSFWSGSLLGGLVALAGTGAACYSMWKGMQKEGQGQAAMSILLIVVSLAVAGLLLILQVWHWIH